MDTVKNVTPIVTVLVVKYAVVMTAENVRVNWAMMTRRGTHRPDVVPTWEPIVVPVEKPVVENVSTVTPTISVLGMKYAVV